MSNPQVISLDGDDWTVSWLEPGQGPAGGVQETESPEAAARRLPASVPGSGQEALLRAGQLPAPFDEPGVAEWERASRYAWAWERRFSLPAELAGSHLFLCLEGIQGRGRAYLNGCWVGEHEGPFVPAEWEVTETARPGEENRLLVVLEPATRPEEAPGSLPWRAGPCGPGPAGLTVLGISGSVSLRVTGAARFRTVAVYANVALDRTEAALSLVSEFDAARDLPVFVLAEVTQAGLPVDQVEDPITLHPGGTGLVQSLTLKRLQPWWPNGLGRPSLYELRLSLYDADDTLLDRRILEFGVRQLDAVPPEGAPPDTLPYGLSVNGRPVWIRGWRWSRPSCLPGERTEERYSRLLRLSRDAGVNLLRVPAGDGIETDLFYRLCDRHGIMVWQDFPLAGRGAESAPHSNPTYLNALREQAEAVVLTRRSHASLVLWCGGDWLADAEGSALGSDHPALAELRAVVETEDPQRLWRPCSPSGPHLVAEGELRGELHDVADPFGFNLRDLPARLDALDPLLYQPVGSASAIRTSDRELVDLLGKTLSKFWGPLEGEALLHASQAVQAIGIQYAVEACRRRQGRCAGVIPARFNPSWPEAGDTACVEYSGRPRAAYYAVKRAYRPFHVSAAFPTFAWNAEARLRADVWLHNDGEERSLLNVVASLAELEGRELYQENLAAEVGAGSSENVGDLSWRFPPGFAGPFLLLLEVIDEEGETLARNAYLHSRAPDPPFAPFLSAPETCLEAERSPAGVAVRNTGRTTALGVRIEAEAALVGDSDFPLLPGARREIRLSSSEDSVTVSAWNAPAQTTEPL